MQRTCWSGEFTYDRCCDGLVPIPRRGARTPESMSKIFSVFVLGGGVDVGWHDVMMLMSLLVVKLHGMMCGSRSVVP